MEVPTLYAETTDTVTEATKGATQATTEATIEATTKATTEATIEATTEAKTVVTFYTTTDTLALSTQTDVAVPFSDHELNKSSETTQRITEENSMELQNNSKGGLSSWLITVVSLGVALFAAIIVAVTMGLVFLKWKSKKTFKPGFGMFIL